MKVIRPSAIIESDNAKTLFKNVRIESRTRNVVHFVLGRVSSGTFRLVVFEEIETTSSPSTGA